MIFVHDLQFLFNFPALLNYLPFRPVLLDFVLTVTRDILLLPFSVWVCLFLHFPLRFGHAFLLLFRITFPEWSNMKFYRLEISFGCTECEKIMEISRRQHKFLGTFITISYRQAAQTKMTLYWLQYILCQKIIICNFQANYVSPFSAFHLQHKLPVQPYFFFFKCFLQPSAQEVTRLVLLTSGSCQYYPLKFVNQHAD